MQFSYVQIFARQDRLLYFGKWTNRWSLAKALDDLQEVRAFLTEDRSPEMSPAWSAAYMKTPSLLALANINPGTQITRIEAYDILRKNLHPNIATYYGCHETHGRVSALCLRRYKSTLLELVNLRRLNKVAFLESGRELVKENMKLDGILAGIKHLHSHGLVHNDLNPANIMLDEDHELVLIDLESCRRSGELLQATETKRTHHWHDNSVDTSLEKNDLDAFKDLQIWLHGSTNEEFVFD